MADIVHARDDQSRSVASPAGMARRRTPTQAGAGRRDTGSKYDPRFVSGRELYLWVAVFDHTQTRHTRHPRPVRITVEE
jgi:hypothetical protein